MKTINIKPSDKALQVLDPYTFEPLKVTGESKPRNPYWLRRIKDGSVIQMDVKPSTTPEINP